MSTLKNELSLPPNVKGTCRGSIDLSFSEIKFKSKGYSGIQISVLWWGQDIPYCFRFEPSKVIKYKINTNSELFVSYLQNSEPIKLSFKSMKTNLTIGTALIPIHSKLLTINNNIESLSVKLSVPIYSIRNFNIGNLLISFTITSIPVTQEINNNESKMMKTVSSVPEILPKVNTKLCYEKENVNKDIFVQGVPCKFYDNNDKKDKCKLRENNFITSGNEIVRSTTKPLRNAKSDGTKMVDFLAGKSMSVDDELIALKEICSMSPADSLIDLLVKDEKCMIQNDLTKFIDSVKICVANLNLTKAGLKETCYYLKNDNFDISNIQFKVKCRFEHFLHRDSSLKFYSKRQQSSSKSIDFNTEQRSPFKLPVDLSSSKLVVTIWIREFDCKSSPNIFGYSKVNLSELMNNTYSCYKKCPIKLISNDNLILGSLNVNIEFGTRNLHFGQDMMDAFSKEKDLSSDDSDNWDRAISSTKTRNLSAKTMSYKEFCRARVMQHKENDNKKETEKVANGISSAEVNAAINTRPSTSNYSDRNNNVDDEQDQASNMVAQEDVIQKKSTFLCGLLHIAGIRNVNIVLNGGYFIVNKGFWSEDATSTEMALDDVFNYLKIFPIICDDKFLQRVQNNHLILELWQKSVDSTEKLIGITRLPLHQFYIAFRDAAIIDHLSQSKLPVISIDGWSNVVAPLSGELCGQLQVLLAIGTEMQIEYLKISRNLLNNTFKLMDEFKIPVPPVIKNVNSEKPSTSNAQSPIQSTSNHFSMLSSFIENLAQRIPDPNNSNKVAQSEVNGSTTPQLRSTSELLNNLQQALSQRPSVATQSTQSEVSNLLPVNTPIPQHSQEQETQTNQAAFPHSLDNNNDSLFNALIEIESAIHLPKVTISKKFSKRNKGKNQLRNSSNEFEPSSYVTFECTESSPPALVKSHEGMVSATDVVEKSCNPTWNKKFEVLLPVDLMLNPEKRFILRVWRKANNASPASTSIPTPMEDAVIGFSSIDLSVFVSGLGSINSWYNIIDFSGRCNGQIKIKITPLENVTRYRTNSTQSNLITPLSIDVNCDLNNTSLSRALKRKFTELDEITQRLRARLFDVTGDENVDPDDEFENDLNTEVDENELSSSEADDTVNFGWLSSVQNKIFDSEANEFQNNLIGITNPQQSVRDGHISGCSSFVTDQMPANSSSSLKNLIKGHDIDTIINPKIIKNLIDPSCISSSSDSTPVHKILPLPHCSAESHNSSIISNSASIGSNFSQERIRIISNALQNASIYDAEDIVHHISGHDECEQQREVPDGETHNSKEK